MGLISRLFDFTAGTAAVADQVDAELNQIHTLLNGNIEVATNLAPGGNGLARGAFHAYNSDAAYQLATVGAPTKVKLSAEDFDVSGWFDAASNWRYQPLLGGYYRLSGFVQLVDPLNDAEALILDVYKNGAAHRRLGFIRQADPTPNSVGIGGSCIVAANGSSDYFELYASQSNSAARRIGTLTTAWFDGELIGRS